MARIGPADLGVLERSPTSPAALTQGIWEVLSHSVAARAKVDAYNLDTGEYRVVLQGTLDLEESGYETT